MGDTSLFIVFIFFSCLSIVFGGVGVNLHYFPNLRVRPFHSNFQTCEVVITSDGCRVLTCVPRTVAEIEAVMAGAAWQVWSGVGVSLCLEDGIPKTLG